MRCCFFLAHLDISSGSFASNIASWVKLTGVIMPPFIEHIFKTVQGACTIDSGKLFQAFMN